MKIALIGCGSIGRVIARSITERRVKAELVCVYDIDTKKAVEFAEEFHTKYEGFDEMLKEELDLMGPVKLKTVEEAQRRIIDTVRQLEEQGEVVIAGRGGKQDDVVL